jgi:hypothetical protein
VKEEILKEGKDFDHVKTCRGGAFVNLKLVYNLGEIFLKQ